ncbi:hypothetical protein C6500_12215 [Candidatus Poribacteria bacterium]|nr:MAG: hypothetical protein C6500_12215 [Candidatus Poribacteria bacterium]
MKQDVEMKVDSSKTLTTLVFLLVLFSLMPAFALFFDFDDNEKPQEWKEEGGKWKVENGVYVGEELNAVEGVTLIGEEDWTDLTFEATVRKAEGNWMALVVRWVDVNNHYGLWVNLGNSTAEWWVKTGAYAQHGSGAIKLNKEKYKLKIVAKGDTFEGYYNDKLVVTMKHKDHKQGRVGLLVWQGSSRFDDVRITGPGIPGLAVNPQGKLASTWARMKTLY